MSIPSLTRNPMTRQLTQMRSQLEELQRQLGTGKRASTFGTMGPERTQSVTFRGRIADLDAFNSTIGNVSLRVKLLDASLTRMSKVPTDIRASLDPNAYEVRLDGRTDAQKTARLALDEVLGLLNSEADGRYLFSGKSTDVKPVAALDAILTGEAGLAGLQEVVAERKLADLGTTTPPGRLETAVVGPAVTLSRQGLSDNEFGFRILGITPSNPASVTVPAVAAGATSVPITFASAPGVGETIKVSLGLPDGTTTDITLKATLNSPPGKDEFTTGGTADAAAASFKAALDTALTRTSATELSAASAMRGSEMFFDTSGGKLPARVDGPPATATATHRPDPPTTVLWYKGFDNAFDPADPSTNPRNDATARVDSSIEVSYGARANEDGFRRIVQSLAITAVETFSTGTATDEDRYRALVERTRDLLVFKDGQQDPRDIHAEIAIAGKISNDAKERHQVNKSAMQQLLDGVEGVELEEVAAQILTLQTRMQASYQTSSILNQLTLLNYL